MPVAERSTERELALLAADADHRAELEEERYRALALTLLALEMAIILRALGNAQNVNDVSRVFQIARLSLISPSGLARRRWVERFTALMRESAARVSKQFYDTRELPRSVQRAIDIRAEELTSEVTQTTAQRLHVIESATQRVISGPGLVAPDAPEQRAATLEQRRASLVPLLGQASADRVIDILAAGRTQSVAKIARAVFTTLNDPSVTRKRALTIARTESIGLQSTTEFELARDRGLTEKRWMNQGDDRVRLTHVACADQGWISIDARFSNGLLFPGERPAPASETVNCRCTLVFRKG